MNVYYDTNDEPDEFGLAQIDILDENDLSYAYNTLIVFRHKPTGRLFWTQDSGCSCPIPFEDDYFRSPDDTNLEEIKKGDSFTSFERVVQEFPVSQSERDECVSKVKKLLKKK